MNIAAYVFIIIPAFAQDAAIYNTYAASIEDLASDGTVSLFESMMHSIGLLNPISTGGGVFHPPICILPITFLLLSQFPPNLVTFPNI